jgi:hypothetical protein
VVCQAYAQLLLYPLAGLQIAYKILPKTSKNTPLPSNKLKKAVMALGATLGYAAAETLIYDLENYGIALVAGKAASYTLDQVEDAIKKILGDEAGSLVMEHLIKILEEE